MQFWVAVGDEKGMHTQQNNLVHKKRKPESGALHHHGPFILRHLVKRLRAASGDGPGDGGGDKTHVIDGLLVT